MDRMLKQLDNNKSDAYSLLYYVYYTYIYVQ